MFKHLSDEDDEEEEEDDDVDDDDAEEEEEDDDDDDDDDAGTSQVSKASDSRSLPDEQKRIRYLDKRAYRYMSDKFDTKFCSL